jgi:hypothetical protein
VVAVAVAVLAVIAGAAGLGSFLGSSDDDGPSSPFLGCPPSRTSPPQHLPHAHKEMVHRTRTRTRTRPHAWRATTGLQYSPFYAGAHNSPQLLAVRFPFHLHSARHRALLTTRHTHAAHAAHAT